ncbi:hypothetical protein IQ288_31550 [Burkholderia sp. R-69980]|nr:hypothetical protein [Burkholderia sp. R-69980]
MSLALDDIYALLPAVFRTRDAATGGPLKALLGVIYEQIAVLDDNLSALYDDEFIETCAPWVIPYIGDLVGWQAITPAQRAEVADTIGYRRRKGTLIALEQIARDVTGRPAHVVEYFKRLATTESMHHIRPHHASWIDLRRGGALARLGTPFDPSNRTIDVRRIAPRARMPNAPDNAPLDVLLHGAGRYNIADIGAFLWRWKAYPVRGQAAFAVDARRFMVSPLGNDMPLFNQPIEITLFASLSGRMNVPQPIGRREFFDHRDAFYGSLDATADSAPRSVQLYRDGAPVPLDQICVRDLSDTDSGDWPHPPSGHVAIDPVLGRIAFPRDADAPGAISVDYFYGFPADIGGGPYDRSADLVLPKDGFDWLVVIGGPASGAQAPAATLGEAIAQWNGLTGGPHAGLIVLPNYYAAQIDLTGAAGVQIRPGDTLWIVAGEPHVDKQGRAIMPGFVESRATLSGDIDVVGVKGAAGSSATAGQLWLSSVVLAGGTQVSGEPLTLRIADSTLVPGHGLTRDNEPLLAGKPSVVVTSAGTTVRLVRAICGPLLVAASASIVRICASIIDATARHGVAYAGADGLSEGATLHVEDSTVIGKVHTYLMELASNTIFFARSRASGTWPAALWCTRQQTGCVRFCWLPARAIVPAHYACLQSDPDSEGALEPHFVTLRYGRPSYGLVSGDCPVAIWQGADDRGELGVYHALAEPQAVANLFTRLGEYLPFALEAGIFLIPSRTERRRVGGGYGYGYGDAAALARRAQAAIETDDLSQDDTGIGTHLI